jgi:hypothetical protein
MMKRSITFFVVSLSVLSGSLSGVPGNVRASPREVFTDPQTGYEVWRMTDDPGMDWPQYYHHPTMSPDGRHLIFRTYRYPWIYIINSDGTGERAFADIDGIDFSRNNLQGWYSNDSKKYYSYVGLFEIDIEKFLNDSPEDEYLRQISPEHGDSFYYPMVSPDGGTLFGIANSNDIDSRGTVKLIGIDGSGYREFAAPGWETGGFDVSHGWVGNDQAWYLNNSQWELYTDVPMVFDVGDGSHAGRLDVGDRTWAGLFTHPILSPSGCFIGDGEGYIAGNGRGGLLYANTRYWTQDETERDLGLIGPTLGNHTAVSSDGLWVVSGATEDENAGFITVYPVPPASPQVAVHVARFTDASQENDFSAYATWSSDGTKVIFRGDVRETGNDDIYMAVFKKPDAPVLVSAVKAGSTITLAWEPAFEHREIKEYEIYSSDAQDGTYTRIDSVPEVYTHLDAVGRISAAQSTLDVDSTEGFPGQGVVEVMGLSTEVPGELVAYTSRTPTSFSGLTRGYGGTAPAEHWNDSFVWKYTGHAGYEGVDDGNNWYRVRSVEWSGLPSDMSEPVFASEPEPADEGDFAPDQPHDADTAADMPPDAPADLAADGDAAVEADLEEGEGSGGGTGGCGCAIFP